MRMIASTYACVKESLKFSRASLRSEKKERFHFFATSTFAFIDQMERGNKKEQSELLIYERNTDLRDRRAHNQMERGNKRNNISLFESVL